MEIVELSKLGFDFIEKSFPCGVLITTTYPALKIKYANETLIKMLGYENLKELMKKNNDSSINLVHEEDLPRIREEIEKEKNQTKTYEATYRLLNRDGESVWVIQRYQYIIVDGKEYLFSYFTDITSQKEAKFAAERQYKQLISIYNAVTCPLLWFTYDENPSLLYINSEAVKLLGFKDRKTIIDSGKYNLLEYVFVPDREKVAQGIRELHDLGDRVDLELRLTPTNDQVLYINATFTLALTIKGKLSVSGIFLDVTKDRIREQELKTEKQKLDIAINTSGIDVWEYDIVNKRLIHPSKLVENYNMPEIIENIPEAVMNYDFVHEKSLKDYFEMYESVLNGIPKVTKDILFVQKDKHEKWERCTYTTMFDDDGKPIKAIGCSVDITSTVEKEKRYREEEQYQKAIESENLLVKVRLNITKNIVESDIPRGSVGVSFTGRPYTEAIEALADTADTDDQKDHIRKMLDRGEVLEAYQKGEKTWSFEYQRKLIDGSVIWVNTTIKTYQNPDTLDIMSFMYTYDINQQKMSQITVDRIAESEYELLAIIDKETGIMSISNINNEDVAYGDLKKLPYKEAIENILVPYVLDDEKEICLAALGLDTIIRQLEIDQSYNCYFSLKNQWGNIKRKKWKFCYLDDTKKDILLSRNDITDIFESEQRQRLVLQGALRQAQQASIAKTEFLSRMSHEIRTPMNAIIGMTTLAAQAIKDPVEVADCLSKIGLSARFLLSLINDILDMSRIESGKVVIKSEKIAFEDFINGINAMCFEQAKAKGVGYDAIMTSFTEDNYVGDSMKLQQILINIISNAIKFTPKNGKVQFIINQDKIEDDKAYMRFTINDTGIGIKEEFIPKIFEPFEQEHTGSTSMYGGTGLGLAICKHLVDLMGGKISVNSIEGVGTEFTIEVPLQLSEENNRRVKVKSELDFEKISALIVDDEIVICQHTHKILCEMGVKADWVDSGSKAVERVRLKWANGESYSIILVDWKMPEMDGIETARKIREIVGPDVTIIIMTAYDWVTIENEAKQAGVNMLVSKPLFKSSIASTFEKVFIEKEQKEIAIETIEYDFKGKRVLLVEDHMLNVEVAKRLLNSKNMEVEVAENGLAAIEAFATSPLGYFDAILMDIRMPIMDGLTAAKSIRQLKKKTAKTIPIIAMSANAFDEDIEKSKEAGMDAHLAKPIEPAILYQTLNNFI